MLHFGQWNNKIAIAPGKSGLYDRFVSFAWACDGVKDGHEAPALVVRIFNTVRGTLLHELGAERCSQKRGSWNGWPSKYLDSKMEKCKRDEFCLF